MPTKSSAGVRIFSPRFERAELIELLRQRLRSLSRVLPLARATLFGSWAHGNATAFSDIDVLIVYADPPRAEAYQLAWKILNVRGLQPHVYSVQEARALQSTLDRMTRGGTVLFEA